MSNRIVDGVVMKAWERLAAEYGKPQERIEQLTRIFPQLRDEASALRAVADLVEVESTQEATKKRVTQAQTDAAKRAPVVQVVGIGSVTAGAPAHLARIEKQLEIKHAEDRLEKARRSAGDADREAQEALNALRRGAGNKDRLTTAAENTAHLAKAATQNLRTAEAELEQLRKLT